MEIQYIFHLLNTWVVASIWLHQPANMHVLYPKEEKSPLKKRFQFRNVYNCCYYHYLFACLVQVTNMVSPEENVCLWVTGILQWLKIHLKTTRLLLLWSSANIINSWMCLSDSPEQVRWALLCILLDIVTTWLLSQPTNGINVIIFISFLPASGDSNL